MSKKSYCNLVDILQKRLYVKILRVLLCPTKGEAIGDGGGVPESQSECHG